MKKTLMMVAAVAMTLCARAQVSTNEPTYGLTNAPVGSVIGFAFALLPQWDRNALRFTNVSEIEIKVAPLWKTATAAGSTPYLSASADWWFKQVGAQSHLGLGGEMVTLGNGTGNDTVDSVSAYFEARKAMGNIAGYLMAGVQRDINLNRYAFEFGPGVEIRYATGIGLFLDTRLVEPFSGSSGKVDWMTRFGVSVHF